MAITFHISVKPGLIGKDVSMNGVWETREMSPRQLAEWSFFQHQGYCHSVFDADKFRADPQGYKMSKANDFFLFSEVVTVDIDSKDLTDEELRKSNLTWFLEQPFIREHCFLITPSSGNSAFRPNWHLSFKLDQRITDPQTYRRVALAVQAQIGIATDHQTAKASQPTMGTLFKDPVRHARGYHWEDIYVNEDATPVPVEALMQLPIPEGSRLAALQQQMDLRVRAEIHAGSDLAQKRLAKHFAQAESDRERVVLEALAWVLDNWPEDADYDLWFQTWTSAHHGSPTPNVRDYIVNHPRIVWSDGEYGQAKFVHTWNHHRSKEGGYTVASLFYLARQAGWLTQTGYEIPEKLAETIEARFLPDWLQDQADIPRRLLLQSQTGSGKTQSLIHLWRRLGEPKTVVFVPTVKLAADLTTTLRKAGIPAVNYRNLQTGRVIAIERLKSASVLVTTLQTFASKVHQGEALMAEYGLVYVEESDQLLSQFARGGGGLWSSHVRDREARAGFTVLHDALQHSHTVWLVDATMSLVTYEAANALSSLPVRYVLNTWTRKKADVHLVNDRGEALQKVLEGLAAGKRVVAACDTKEQAKEVVEAMRLAGALDGKQALVITRDSEHLPAVQAFMSDVNEEAPKYDLVAYNSVMASGVSVTAVKPDVLVQFCTFLSPRQNLQILNRYREQDQVYCFYSPGENFYKLTADEVVEEAKTRVKLESDLINVPFVEREALAKLRERLGAISVGDEQMQSRSPREFYIGLLEADGRTVHSGEKFTPPEARLEDVMKDMHEEGKAMRDRISRSWRKVPIVDEDHPATKEMDDETVLAGVLHGQIRHVIGRDPLPLFEGLTPTEADQLASEMARITRAFRGKEFFLSAFAMQEQAISRAELYLADRGKAILTIANTATINAVLLLVRLLYHRLDDHLTPDVLAERVEPFLAELGRMRDAYDSVVVRSYHKYEAMEERYGDDRTKLALELAKVILARVGLKQKYEQRRKQENGERKSSACYYIENLEDANKLMGWKFPSKPHAEVELDLNQVWQEQPHVSRIERNRQARAAFTQLAPEQQHRVLELYTTEQYTTFEDAVWAVLEGETAL